MTKSKIVFIVIWCIISISAYYAWKGITINSMNLNDVKVIYTHTPEVQDQRTNSSSIFIPYWSISSAGLIDSKYSEILYFGLSATSNGIDMTDPGFKNLKTFSNSITTSQKKLLVIRMLNAEEDNKILSDPHIQKKIISQSIEIGKQNGFSGIVLDLEFRSLPFYKIVNKIDALFDLFSQETKQNKLVFDATMYGDTFYRPSPFDLQYLARDVDHVYIMAYDLHKVTGQPGPNFPLAASENDYDIKKMTQDFNAVLPTNKITVVFGMFGYSWMIDNQGQSFGTADTLSDLQIQKNFLKKCYFQNCKIKKDELSQETVIHYVSNNAKRILWFEDTNSVQQKEIYLEQHGIHQFSFWAYSYF